MIEAKKEDVKIKTSEKWKYCTSITLWYLLSSYHRLHLWNMDNKMVMNEKKKEKKSILSWIYVESWIEHYKGVQRTS